MSRPPNNDDPPRAGRPPPKRFKGTLVGFRVPEGAAAPGPSPVAQRVPEPPAEVSPVGPATRLWGGEGPPRTTVKIPKNAAPEKSTLLGGYVAPIAGGSMPAVPPPKPTEVMLDPDHGDDHDDPLAFSAPSPRVPSPARAQPSGPLNLPMARRYDGASLRPEPAAPVRMSKWIYRFTIFGGLAGTAALAIGATTSAKLGALLVFLIWIPLVPAVLMICVFLYKMWSAIDDGHARTTPGKAVAYLFVPLFNLYWAFEVVPGFATDYNAYLERHAIAAPKMNRNLFLATLVPVVGLLVLWLLIDRICEGVRALSA